MGRGGRDVKFLYELVLFKMYKGYLKYVELEFVCIVKDSVCWRSMLCVVF